jgi:hypothetical protein
LGANKKALKVIPKLEIYEYVKYLGQKKIYYTIAIEYYGIKNIKVN